MFSIQSFLTWQSKLLMTYKHLSQFERYQIARPPSAMKPFISMFMRTRLRGGQVPGGFNVGSTDTASSPLFIKKGQAQFTCDAVGEGCGTEGW